VVIKPKRPLNECSDILLYMTEWQRRFVVNVPEVFQVHATAAKLNSKHQRGARSYSEIIVQSHNFIISRNHYEIHGPHEHIATS